MNIPDLASLPLVSTPLWLGVYDLSCPSIDRFHCLLATRADSESRLTWGKSQEVLLD